MNLRYGLRSAGQWIKDHPVPFTAGAITVIIAASLGTVFGVGYYRNHQAAPSCVALTCVADQTSKEQEDELAIPATSPTATPAPSGENLLIGTAMDAAKANYKPLAVMIENSPEARPQSGLGSADLVYEAIAEGGITRFMAVYADPTIPVKVGPVRSARTYYVDFATELGALYAHVGGNLDALDALQTISQVGNLDQFAIGAPTFQREFTRNVALEHTMYSSTEKLWAAATARKYSLTANFDSWKFTDEKLAGGLETQKVTVNFSSAGFQVVWNFDPSTGMYNRVMAGQPHLDANTSQQITTRTVILETVANTPIVTRINEKGWKYTLTGSGKATVIRDGVSTPATWKKTGTERTRYYDAAGTEIAIPRGKVWVEIIHKETSVTGL